jgi:hypothetical protein
MTRLFGRGRGLAMRAEGDLGDNVFGDVVFFKLFQLVTFSKSNFEGLSLVFLLLLLLLARELSKLNSRLKSARLSVSSVLSSSDLFLRPFFLVSSWGAGGGLVLKYGSKGTTDDVEVVVVEVVGVEEEEEEVVVWVALTVVSGVGSVSWEVLRVMRVRVDKEGVVCVSTSVCRVLRLGGV